MYSYTGLGKGRFIAVSTQHTELILVLFIHYCNISMQMTINLLLPHPVLFFSILIASFLSHLNLVYLLPVSFLHNPSSRVARRINTCNLNCVSLLKALQWLPITLTIQTSPASTLCFLTHCPTPPHPLILPTPS